MTLSPSNFGIATKVALFVSAMVLLTVASIGFWSYRVFDKTLVEEELKQLATTSRITGIQFSSSVTELRHDVTFLAGTPPINGLIRARRAGGVDPYDGSTELIWRQRLATIFTEMLRANPEYMGIRYIGEGAAGQELVRVSRDLNSAAIHTTPETALSRVGAREYYRDTLALPAESVYISEISLSRRDGYIDKPYIPLLRVAIPVYNNGRAAYGIVVIEKDLRTLFTKLRNAVPKEQELYLFNAAGYFLMHPDADKTFGFELGTPHRIQTLLPESASLLVSHHRTGQVVVDRMGDGPGYAVGLRKTAFDPARPERFVGIAVRANYDQVITASLESQRATITVTLVLLPIVLLLGLLFSKTLTGPLRRITQSIQSFADSKDFDDPQLMTPLPVNASGEAGVLARAFDHLRARVLDRTASLSESEARMRTVLDTVVDGIITMTEQGIVQSFNPAAETIFGYRSDEVIGKNISMLMPAPYRDEHDQYLANFLATGDAKIIGIGREVEGRRRDGSIFPLDLSVSEMQVGDTRLFTGILRDITERKKIDRMKNEFISTVSHELRTPLTSIRGSLGLISGGMGGELSTQARSLIDIACKNTDRLVRMINDILDVEKIESGKMQFSMEPLGIEPLIIQALDSNAGYAEKFGVSINKPVIQGNLMIQGDHDRLMQVLTNLLSNAIKFSPPNGQVEVEARLVGQAVRITVTDQGPGIPEEFKAKIFQKFSQADSTDTRIKGGSGLGLSIVKAIVERHGGSIAFEPAPEGGTSFYFDIPSVSVGESMSLSTQDSNKRILVTEDDKDIARLLQLMFEREGYRVDLAYDAQAAKALLKLNKYDVITLDLMLPGQNGVALMRELKDHEETADIPIIVVSARASDDSVELKGCGFPIIEYIDKPIESERLLRAVRKTAHKQNLTKANILHVEDSDDVLTVVQQLLHADADLTAARTLVDAKEHLSKEEFDLMILDISMPDGSGLSLLPLVSEAAPDLPVIIFSAYDIDASTLESVKTALVKSRTSNEQLLETVRAAISA